MKRFIVFLWNQYDEAGGWGDALGYDWVKNEGISSFDTAEEAEAAITVELAKDSVAPLRMSDPRWEIVDLHTGRVAKKN